MRQQHIDGIRAIAVLAVMLFHYKLAPFSGGYVGVDIFFVISGFLITDKIDISRPIGRELRSFYLRRLRRILPALAVVVVAALAGAYCLYLPGDLRGTGRAAIGAILFYSNIVFLNQADDYFRAGDLGIAPLLHTWSLGVELQFYLAIPLILYLTRARSSWLSAIAVISFASCELMLQRWAAGAFYLPSGRLWEFLLGALALRAAERFAVSRRAAEAAGCTGLALVLLPVFIYSQATPFPGVAALAPCLGAALLLASGHRSHDPVAIRLLGAGPLAFIGRISYSLYLWHWPLLVFAAYGREAALPWSALLLLAAATMILAFLSWKLVERPFIEKRVLPEGRSFVACAAASALALAALGGCTELVGLGKLPSLTMDPAVKRLADGQFDRVQGNCKPIERTSGHLPCWLGAAGGRKPTFLLWGNSFARMWTPALSAVAASNGVAGQSAIISTCPPFVGEDFADDPECKTFNDRTLAFLKAHEAIRTVVLAGNWTAWGERLKSLEETARAVRSLGRRLVIVRTPPRPDYPVPRALALSALHRQPPPPLMSAAQNDANRALETKVMRDLAANHGAVIIDPAPRFCASGVCAVAMDGRALYYDQRHITTYAARAFESIFQPVFQQSEIPDADTSGRAARP